MDFATDLENSPTLEEDMAAFPDKTEEEVKCARRLWDSGTIQFSHYQNTRYFSCRAICTASSFFRDLFTSSRPWPCLQWERVFSNVESGSRIQLWFVFDTYMDFFYEKTFEVKHTDLEWLALFGAIIKDAALYNFCMINIWNGFGRQGSTQKTKGLLASFLATLVVEDYESITKAYDNDKYVMYAVDKIVWDQNHSLPDRGAHPLLQPLQRFINEKVVHAQANSSTIAPFQEPNRHKYLMSEPEGFFWLKTDKEDHDELSPSVKREISPGGEVHRKKRARTLSPRNCAESVVKEEELAEEVEPRTMAQANAEVIFDPKLQEEDWDNAVEISMKSSMEVNSSNEANIDEVTSGFGIGAKVTCGRETDFQKQEAFKITKPEAKGLKIGAVDIDTEPGFQVTRVRRVKKISRKDVYDLT